MALRTGGVDPVGDIAFVDETLVELCSAVLRSSSTASSARAWTSSASPTPTATWTGSPVAAEGLSIAAWVLLWHPLAALVLDRWDFRLDRRVLKTVRDKSTVRIRPLDAGTE
jgi:hypothetical protein